MGYGHLRAARAVADALGTGVVRADAAPLASDRERALWRRSRLAYEVTSRLSQLPGVGAPGRWALDAVTRIPHLHPLRDLSAPTHGARVLARLVAGGLGEGMIDALRASGRALVTTFYAPAIAADRGGVRDVFCVVTDTDVNRIWAPVEPRATRIRYLVPTHRAARRLEAYGVPRERITFTGFPLPEALTGGPGLEPLRRHLAARLARLDPRGAFRRERREELLHFLGPQPPVEDRRPPLVTYAVGGAGAQAGLAATLVRALRRDLEEGRLRLALVAGTRPEVARWFEEVVRGAGLEARGDAVAVLHDPSFDGYLDRMNALLAETDVLWTKPSELCFYAALGIPLVCAAPVGVHERLNRRWVRESGAGFKQRDPRFAGEWIAELLAEGAFAAAAWAGFLRLPKFGLPRILEAVAEARSGSGE